jgi:hypothetical protein
MRDDSMDEDTIRTPPPPLPREWLPDALPADDDPVWARRADRILAAADPELARLRTGREAVDIGWWSEMGRWWRPAAAMAAAAVTLFVLVERPASTVVASPDAITLGLVAGEGSPAAIWAAVGVRADPVLARLALEDHAAIAAAGGFSAAPGGDER